MENLKNIAEIFIMLGNELNKIADEKSKQEEKEVLLSKQDVLDKYKCFNSSSLNNAVKNGLISYKVGKNRFYKAIDIDNWISEKSVDSHKSFIRF